MTRTTRTTRTSGGRAAAPALLAAVSALALAACGSSSSSASPSSGSPASSGRPSTSTSAPASAPASAGSTPGGPSAGADNGEAGKPAAQVLADTKTALFNAGAVHVKGEITDKGQAQTLDMQFQGQDASGTIGVLGSAVTVVRTGGKLYLRAPAAFWQRTAGAAGAKLGDKWLIVDQAQAGGLADLTLQTLAAALSAEDSPLQPQVTRTTVAGQPAVQIAQQDGSTVAAAATGQPVPLVLTSKGASTGQLVFSDYGKTTPLVAPPGAVTPQQAAAAPATGGA